MVADFRDLSPNRRTPLLSDSSSTPSSRRWRRRSCAGSGSRSGVRELSVRVREAREGLNPKTQERVQTPARRRPLFRVAKKLYERINRSTVSRSGEVAADIDSGGPSGEKERFKRKLDPGPEH